MISGSDEVKKVGSQISGLSDPDGPFCSPAQLGLSIAFLGHFPRVELFFIQDKLGSSSRDHFAQALTSCASGTSARNSDDAYLYVDPSTFSVPSLVRRNDPRDDPCEAGAWIPGKQLTSRSYCTY
jgi:hypothetical protein